MRRARKRAAARGRSARALAPLLPTHAPAPPTPHSPQELCFLDQVVFELREPWDKHSDQPMQFTIHVLR